MRKHLLAPLFALWAALRGRNSVRRRKADAEPSWA